MTKETLGRKIGTTQIFTKDGISVPVTVVEAAPSAVLQVKASGPDDYEIVRMGYQNMREVLSNKSTKGHAAKAETPSKRSIQEVRDVGLKDYGVGSEIAVDSFSEGDVVNVTGATRGHGTQDSIERWGQSRGSEIHDSRYHRTPSLMGSIINRVPKDKKLLGHMGGKKVTVQDLVIKGAVPKEDVFLTEDNVPGIKDLLIFIKSAARVAK